MILKMRKDNGRKHSGLEEGVPAMYWDTMFNAFHHEAAKSVLEPILPFWSNFDKQSWWYSYSMLVVMSEGGVSLRTMVISNWSKLCSL